MREMIFDRLIRNPQRLCDLFVAVPACYVLEDSSFARREHALPTRLEFLVPACPLFLTCIGFPICGFFLCWMQGCAYWEPGHVVKSSGIFSKSHPPDLLHQLCSSNGGLFYGQRPALHEEVQVLFVGRCSDDENGKSPFF